MRATTNLKSDCEKAHHCEMEQRVNIKFCFKLGKTATKTHEMLVKVYGVDAVSKKCVFEGFKRFRDGKEDVKDEPRSGRPPINTTPDNI
ncbi:Putative uncharacterized protein FLJ37770 [Araneus ventricosus]|uniref:Mos1 transposase HTH domain-containing protein n=1 Tax=Araneus ventricosus TaxID=182803 RepID=A0A4Y2X8I6_ARAVE|nr:Putative uncharacterized protein FLJ37770 [Araneus ventricosus]GBO45489.1 Putative uncharacterized protein FLJ37770 [Araneus ventricosus]GBO45546.1 Putative uncharacterized protein FLJ37770 [Araneus ventricosus]GBO45549.1 Putative uncharacterized protein FLJ37770 [Araneus ventricosus]